MELAVGRGTMGGASWKDLAFFGGGQDAEKNNTDIIDIFNVTSAQDKAAKSTVGIQTSALFTPEVEFFRQTIKGQERKWGNLAETLPLTHKDTRTYLRKAKAES